MFCLLKKQYLNAKNLFFYNQVFPLTRCFSTFFVLFFVFPPLHFLLLVSMRRGGGRVINKFTFSNQFNVLVSPPPLFPSFEIQPVGNLIYNLPLCREREEVPKIYCWPPPLKKGVQNWPFFAHCGS